MLFTNQERKVEIQYLPNVSPIVDNGEDVVRGLTTIPKSLPPKYFYDRLGSQLFEQICDLPEYYPTRTEMAILNQSATEITNITGICELVELGSGSSSKTRLLLSAYEKLGQPWQYVPIDVSSEILQQTALQLQGEYENLSILGLVGTYEQALLHLPPSSLSSRMIIFLGSSLGNFTQEECDRLFNEVRDILQPKDYFLLGIDLQKPKNIIELAYNDSQNITADFNLNMLSHLNWRFEGNFNPDLWQHQAIYNEKLAQIEMYLKCQEAHQVFFKKLDLKINFSNYDTILTEISRKFNLTSMENFLQSHELNIVKYWTDPQQYFALILTQMQ